MNDDPELALSCIACGKELKNLTGINLPSQGVVFTSHGNYGSHVFDPMDSTFLEINICDECLLKANKKEGTILFGAKEFKKYDIKYMEWKND